MKRRQFIQLASVTSLAAIASNAETALPNYNLQPDLIEANVTELQHQMQIGATNAKDIATGYLARIKEIDGNIKAVVEINPDALKIADELDNERKAGKVRSPMHGIPVLLKDNIDTADKMKTTAGSLALLDAPMPKQDAFLVQRLREAGAVILGKTNLSEWANFRSDNSSSGWSGRGGQTRNPYMLDRSPCGSSSGSGAAISANLCAVAIGTETDGSIVCPSSINGIVGFKPTLGLVSRSGIIPIAHSQDTAGPMCRSVADAAVLLSIIAGIDKNDALTAKTIENDYTKFLNENGLKGKIIGVARQFWGRNERVDKLMDLQIEVLKKSGAELIDVQFPTLHQFGDAESEVLNYEFKADINKYLQKRGGKIKTLEDLIRFNDDHQIQEMPYFAQEIFIKAQRKGGLESNEYRLALLQSKVLTQEKGIDEVIDRHHLDAIMAPSNSPVWMIDLINGDSPANYVGSSSLAAVAGYPNITVPAGFISDLPIGVSFFGKAFSEPKLFEIAYAFEQITKARKQPKFLPTVR